MAKNAKPRKKYKAKLGGLPLTIRSGSAGLDTYLAEQPHVALSELRQKRATDHDLGVLQMRCQLGLILIQLFQEAETQADVLGGIEALVQIKQRQERVGRWGATEEELEAVGVALLIVDEVFAGTTRREHIAAAKALEQVMKS